MKPRVLTEGQAAIQFRVSAETLGRWRREGKVRTVNSTFQPRKYTSYERDGNGGDDAMMRRYGAGASRFSQPDPYDGSYDFTKPQSLNRYAYVQNDPVNFVDPSGLDDIDIGNVGNVNIPISWNDPIGAGLGSLLGDVNFRLVDPFTDLQGPGPQNPQPTVDVGGVRDQIAEWLKNPDCANYVANLIKQAASQNRGNPAVSTNLLDLFDSVRGQGGFVRLEVGTHANPSYSHVRGYIPKNSATYLAPLKLYPDMSAGEIARGALSLDSIGAFHELTHLAGSKQYDDRQLSRAAHRLGGPALPKDRNNKNLAFSRYLDDELRRNCGIR